MKKSLIFSLLLIVTLKIEANPSHGKDETKYEWVASSIEKALDQANFLVNRLTDSIGMFPRTVQNGKLILVNKYDWTSGFFPGTLWYLYELTGDENLRINARKYTNQLIDLQSYKKTHDLGFMIYCSYGNAKRLSPEDMDSKILLNTAESLCSRFSSTVGLIRSWDFGSWTYPVIIDNMMNLELLFRASEISGNKKYRDIAISHADKTLKNHFRSDYSTYHVVDYDTKGNVISKTTHQGYSDNSCWSRGESWALYGFTMCYRFTQNARYLERAENIADYIMNHPNTPKDRIPYWDYDAPQKFRDASAGAIIASALLELGNYSPKKDKYINYAEQLLKSLSSKKYLAKEGSNNGFILKHSTGNLPAGVEIDEPLNYADYYYVEALTRYSRIKNIRYK